MVHVVHKQDGTEFIADDTDEYVTVVANIENGKKIVVGVFKNIDGVPMYFPTSNVKEGAIELSGIGIEPKDLRALWEFAERTAAGR